MCPRKNCKTDTFTCNTKWKDEKIVPFLSVTSIHGSSILYSVFLCPAQLRDFQRRYTTLIINQILLLFLTHEKGLILPQLHYVRRSKKMWITQCLHLERNVLWLPKYCFWLYTLHWVWSFFKAHINTGLWHLKLLAFFPKRSRSMNDFL